MKITELRIGNWVKQPNGIIEVFTVSDLDDEGDINSYLEDEIEPIPLTEEWLIKFGFERWNDVYNNFYHKLNGVEIENGNIYVGHGNEIKYAHQLQNLYFALTGEELNKQD
jgi:hypothetical protein